MFKLITKVWKTGNSLVITIPKEKAEFEGLDVGDDVYAIIRKENEVVKEEENEED